MTGEKKRRLPRRDECSGCAVILRWVPAGKLRGTCSHGLFVQREEEMDALAGRALR